MSSARSIEGGGTGEEKPISWDVKVHISAALLVALTIATASPEADASAARCGQGTVGVGSYAYAGYQAASTAHGVRATITTLSIPDVRAGHVAAWVGVGGRASGPGGADSWLQAGIAAWPGKEPFIYAEIVLDGRPELRTIAADVAPGRAHRLAVLEIRQRPGWWRVWVDGSLVVDAVRLAGTAAGWRPMATAESWSGDGSACNSFAFRFHEVALAGARGGSWRPFSAGRRFVDLGYRLRRLEPSSANGRVAPSFAFDSLSSWPAGSH